MSADEPRTGMRVLAVDDDARFRRFTTMALEAAGIGYEAAEDAEAGIERLRSHPAGHFDAILLDVQMPGADGWELLLRIREEGNEIPVIFVTASEGVQEKVKGLRLGADDYIAKPVEYDELIARVEAVVRRRRALPTLHFGDLTLDLARRRVSRADATIELTPREYDLLLTLVRAEGAVVSRDALLREVWDIEFETSTNVVDVQVGRLRKKLQRSGRDVVETVRGEGYRAVRRD